MADQFESLKAKILSGVDSSDPVALERTLATIKVIAEIEKIENDKEKDKAERSRAYLESENLTRQARLERTRLWLPIIVPAVSAVILAALTFVFQVFQLEKANRAQQDSAWDSRWRDAIRTLSEAKTPEARVAGVTFLGTFSGSERYREPAHKLALGYLRPVEDPIEFRTLCPIVFADVGWRDFDDLAAINRSLGDRYADLDHLMQPNAEDRKRLKAEQDNVVKSIVLINSKIVAALKDRPPTEHAKLDFLTFFFANLKGVRLTGASIRYCGFAYSDVTDADFSNVEDYDGSTWNGVAWWKANAISQHLLTYLESKYSFKEPKANYGAVPTDAEDYRMNISRLKQPQTQSPTP
jgi:hypothetical protein